MSRKNALVTLTADDNGTLTFTVGNAGSFTIEPAALSEEVRNRALVHGIVQKISDAAAIAKADLPTDPAEVAAVKLEAMQSVASRLIEGEWSKRSGDGSGPVAGIIYRAFAEWVTDMAAKKKAAAPSDEKMRSVYDAKTRAEQLALRNIPAVAKIIERMKSERGASAVQTVDTGALLSDLGI